MAAATADSPTPNGEKAAPATASVPEHGTAADDVLRSKHFFCLKRHFPYRATAKRTEVWARKRRKFIFLFAGT